jgi:hypothetical protein
VKQKRKVVQIPDDGRPVVLGDHHGHLVKDVFKDVFRRRRRWGATFSVVTHGFLLFLA